MSIGALLRTILDIDTECRRMYNNILIVKPVNGRCFHAAKRR